MRSRGAMVAAVVVVVAVVALVIIRFVPSPARPGIAQATLSTDAASYLGVYEAGAPQSYEPVARFAKTIGRQPNLVGYYSGWEEPFKASFAQTVSGHGAATIIQWDPTLVSLAAIAAGQTDRYLRSFALSVRDFGKPLVIGFGHEMNAPWYSWGYGNTPARTFVAAWRHIVTLFRDQGADNVTWLWTINADMPDTGSIVQWWPGGRYVTWVGIDGYYYRPTDSFGSVFGKTIAQARVLTGKPVLLSETAVGPIAGQAAKVGELFTGIQQYQALGLVWFDIAQRGALYHQDWRIENSPAAAAAFRRGAAKLALANP